LKIKGDSKFTDEDKDFAKSSPTIVTTNWEADDFSSKTTSVEAVGTLFADEPPLLRDQCFGSFQLPEPPTQYKVWLSNDEKGNKKIRSKFLNNLAGINVKSSTNLSVKSY
jgi:hypothetical protein